MIPPGRFVACLLALRLADALTTWGIVRAGGVELNPVIQPFAGSLAALVFGPLLPVLALTVFAILAGRYCENTIPGSSTWIHVPVLSIFAAAPASNLAVLVGLPHPWVGYCYIW